MKPAVDVNKEAEDALYQAILEQQAMNKVYNTGNVIVKSNNNPEDEIDYDYDDNYDSYNDDVMASLIDELND